MKHLYLTLLTNLDMKVISVNSKKRMYKEAMLLFADEKYEDAHKLYQKLDGYKKSKELAYLCQGDVLIMNKEQVPLVRYDHVQVGDVIEFGSYIQDNKEKEAIEWLVLEKQKDKMLVISKRVLDCKRYHDTRKEITWEHSNIRKWLNNDFVNDAFNYHEQKLIVETKLENSNNPTLGTNGGNDTIDKMFLLSMQEASKYFVDNKERTAQGTKYAREQGLLLFSDNSCYYFLRTSGKEESYASMVTMLGRVDDWGQSVDIKCNGIRPSMWIKI